MITVKMAEYDIGGIMQQVHNAAAHMSADGYLHGMRVEPVAVEIWQEMEWTAWQTDLV
jgi:hypothetical protein